MESPPHSYRFGPETADRTELEPSKKPVSGWLWDSSESAVWEIPLQVWRFLLAFGFVNFVYCESYVLFGCRESVGKEKTRQENIYIYIEIVNIFHRLRYEKIENCTWLTLWDHSRTVLLRTPSFSQQPNRLLEFWLFSFRSLFLLIYIFPLVGILKYFFIGMVLDVVLSIVSQCFLSYVNIFSLDGGLIKFDSDLHFYFSIP